MIHEIINFLLTIETHLTYPYFFGKASHMATSNFSSVMIYNFTAGVSISSYMAKSDVSETGVCKPLSNERRQ